MAHGEKSCNGLVHAQGFVNYGKLVLVMSWMALA
jgi:hypothetical protein